MNDFINIEDMQEYNQFIEEMQKCSNDYEFSLQKMATKIRDTLLSLTAFETGNLGAQIGYRLRH